MRFADDFVIALEDCHSGKQLLDVLEKRLGRYGLTLHEAKTRHVDFRRRRPYGRHWTASATTSDFLGFTHVWGRSMQGKDVVRQITAKGRFARALKSAYDWCKRNRHLPIEAQHDYLARAIPGHLTDDRPLPKTSFRITCSPHPTESFPKTSHAQKVSPRLP